MLPARSTVSAELIADAINQHNAEYRMNAAKAAILYQKVQSWSFTLSPTLEKVFQKVSQQKWTETLLPNFFKSANSSWLFEAKPEELLKKFQQNFRDNMGKFRPCTKQLSDEELVLVLCAIIKTQAGKYEVPIKSLEAERKGYEIQPIEKSPQLSIGYVPVDEKAKLQSEWLDDLFAAALFKTNPVNKIAIFDCDLISDLLLQHKSQKYQVKVVSKEMNAVGNAPASINIEVKDQAGQTHTCEFCFFKTAADLSVDVTSPTNFEVLNKIYRALNTSLLPDNNRILLLDRNGETAAQVALALMCSQYAQINVEVARQGGKSKATIVTFDNKIFGTSFQDKRAVAETVVALARESFDFAAVDEDSKEEPNPHPIADFSAFKMAEIIRRNKCFIKSDPKKLLELILLSRELRLQIDDDDAAIQIGVFLDAIRKVRPGALLSETLFVEAIVLAFNLYWNQIPEPKLKETTTLHKSQKAESTSNLLPHVVVEEYKSQGSPRSSSSTAKINQTLSRNSIVVVGELPKTEADVIAILDNVIATQAKEIIITECGVGEVKGISDWYKPVEPGQCLREYGPYLLRHEKSIDELYITKDGKDYRVNLSSKRSLSSLMQSSNSQTNSSDNQIAEVTSAKTGMEKGYVKVRRNTPTATNSPLSMWKRGVTALKEGVGYLNMIGETIRQTGSM